MKKWTNIFLVILLLFFIWFRFIRKRLPADIPFTLTLFSTILLIFIICVFFVRLLYVLKILIPTPTNFFVKIISIFKQYIYQQLMSNLIIEQYFKLYFPKIEAFMSNNYAFIFLFDIIIQLIMSLTLFMDVFIYKKLYYIYFVIFLVIIRYFIQLCLFFIRQTMMDQLSQIENRIEIRENGFGSIIPLQEYIQQQLNSKTSHKPEIEYDFWVKFSYLKNIAEKYKLVRGQVIDTEHIINNAKRVLNLIISIHNIFILLNLLAIKYKIITISIVTIYLVCWFCILLISLPTFHLTLFDQIFLKHFQEIYEPFSGAEL